MLPRIKEIYNTLTDNEEKLLIHCAAGIHRTGVIAYTLLRMDGKSPLEAIEALRLMRLATYNGVGKNRIDIAETRLVPKLAKIYSS